jgi:hypothetical protein
VTWLGRSIAPGRALRNVAARAPQGVRTCRGAIGLRCGGSRSLEGQGNRVRGDGQSVAGSAEGAGVHRGRRGRGASPPGTGDVQIAAVSMAADVVVRRGTSPSAARANRRLDHRALVTRGRPGGDAPRPRRVVGHTTCPAGGVHARVEQRHLAVWPRHANTPRCRSSLSKLPDGPVRGGAARRPATRNAWTLSLQCPLAEGRASCPVGPRNTISGPRGTRGVFLPHRLLPRDHPAASRPVRASPLAAYRRAPLPCADASFTPERRHRERELPLAATSKPSSPGSRDAFEHGRE